MLHEFQGLMTVPFGRLGISIVPTADLLCGIDFLPGNGTGAVEFSVESVNNAFVAEVMRQLQCYFADPHFQFNLPLALSGTSLYQNIWREMQQIPLGQTATYGDLAERVGTHARVVGNACRRNAIPIIIPCHRIVAANGLGGFAGEMQGPMIDAKKWLLKHETYHLR